MIRTAIAPVVVLAACFSLPPARANTAANHSQDQKRKAEPKQSADPKGQLTTLTGCVDEQEGKWVLVNDQTMAIIASLAADGFPPEAFAKYVGHKVNVRGTANSGDSNSTFKVREIKSLSETCAAQ